MQYMKAAHRGPTYGYNTHLWVAGPYSKLTIVNGKYHAPRGIRTTVGDDTSYEADTLPTKLPRLDTFLKIRVASCVVAFCQVCY